MIEQYESKGRIEVAPSVLITIARLTALKVEGVRKFAAPPAEVLKLFRRATRQDGIVLSQHDGKLIFDVYVLLDPHVNVMDTSRQVQSAIKEAIDKMVGVPVEAINIHVEDVLYVQGDTA